MKLKLTLIVWLLGSWNGIVFSQQRQVFNASALEWKLWGYRPEGWRNDFDFHHLNGPKAQERNIPVTVPGSVNKALLDAGIIDDWNIGGNCFGAEWLEHRSWLFVTRIPDNWLRKGEQILLHFKGLDDNGTVLVNGKAAGTFHNAFIPYTFDITALLKESGNTLAVAFNMPPAYLGQVNWTSRIRDWKPRFYYGWDWIPRTVQIGIWDDVLLETKALQCPETAELRVTAQADADQESGSLQLSATGNIATRKGAVLVTLKDHDGQMVLQEKVAAAVLAGGKQYAGLAIKRWGPNGSGEQPLYDLTCTWLDEAGKEQERISRKIGFKHISWLPAKGAPVEADPWICSVNGKPVFLQGINWTPIRPNFADLREKDYRRLLETYRSLGINMIRIWGGGFAEKDWLYDLCDELGLMIQQDFPLSSSGLDNYPPESPELVQQMAEIVRHYVSRNRHRASMLLWCGGNELYEYGDNAVVSTRHKMIGMMATMVAALDPITRFVPGSPSGINIWGGRNNFGKGVNWDTHGPWTLPFSPTDSTMKAVQEYWAADDALMHSEVGVPGAMSAAMIYKYRGKYEVFPISAANPYWNEFNWWLDDFAQFEKRAHAAKKNSEKAAFGRFVAWSQQRQAEGLAIALKACKDKFPATGGFILWMGHDAYPAPVNTSIIDFEGNLKPAAHALQKIWQVPPYNK